MNFSPPPRECWHPGRITRDIVLARAERLHVVLCAPEMYPTGAAVQVIARFRTSAEAAGQHPAAQRAGAFQHDPQLGGGPRLRYRYTTAEPLHDGRPHGHALSERMATLNYWLPGAVDGSAGLAGEFSWPAQSVHASFAIESAEVAWALASAEQVWPED